MARDASRNVSAMAEFLRDLLQPMGPVSARRMFSGAGLFCDGLMFAIVIADTLYLKADAASQRAFEAEGMGPFTYTAKGRSVRLGYWRAPERLLDEPDDLVDWSRTALAVARRAAAGKVKKNAVPRARTLPVSRSAQASRRKT